MRNKNSFIGRRPAYAKNPRMQGGGHTDIAFCQVIFAHFVNIFKVSYRYFVFALMADSLMLNV